MYELACHWGPVVEMVANAAPFAAFLYLITHNN